MQLKENYTWMMVPLRIHADHLDVSETGLWQPAELKLETHVFYDYIEQWLLAKANTKNRESLPQDAQSYSIYTLRPSRKAADGDSPSQQKLLARLSAWKTFAATAWRQQRTGLAFRFMTDEQELMSVKLFVNEYAHNGLLLMPIRLDARHTEMTDLVTLNYFMDKTDRQVQPCVPDADLSTVDPRRLDSFRRMADGMGLSWTDGVGPQWTMNTLIAFLLGDFTGSYSLFNTTRIHLFTYLRVPRSEWQETEGRADFIRIVRSQNTTYAPPRQHLNDDSLFLQTFDNIYIGASVEGGAMLVLSEPADDAKGASTFVHNFAKANLAKRYLWVYIMVVLQRHSLLGLIGELSAVNRGRDEERSLDVIDSLLERLATIKTCTYYTHISDYTQHNQFYDYCTRQMHIREQYDEISEKMRLLETVAEGKKAEADEVRGRRLEIILAMLTIISGTCDLLSILGEGGMKTAGGLTTVALLILLIVVVWNRKK